MTPNLGLTVKKPISLWNKPLNANFKDLFKSLGKAAINTATGQWTNLGQDAVETLVSLGLESDRAEELAWALIYNSLKKAVFSLIRDSQFLIQDIPNDLEEFVDRLDLSPLESMEFEISNRFFEHPEQLSIVQEIKTPLTQWFEGFGIEQVQAQLLSDRLPAYFVFALNREWQQRPKDYAPITAAMQTPFTKASDREHGWGLYNSWLQKQIQEPMLFEAFGLEDIYISLRAYYRRKDKGDRNGQDDYKTHLGDRETYVRVVVDLAESLQAWSNKADKNDAIRIISGGPGSGKSSFAKIFAARLGATADFPVLFVPLHQFNPSGDLIKAVHEFVRYDEYLKENPLDPDDRNLRLLIIFDGLDELALQGKLAKEVAKDFVREVKDTVSQFNRNKTRLQVLFTGREVTVQESFKDPQQVLHVLPYFVPKANREKENGELYQDQEQRLDRDQRNDWWQKYAGATQTSHTQMPKELDLGNLTEVTAQPLLNYLVALSYLQGKLTLSEKTNLNQVYADLLNAVYERGYEDNRQHIAVGDLTKAQFIRILEEIALAAWHGDGRTTTVEEIQRHCKNSGLQRLLESFEKDAEAGVTRLLAAFYFRQRGVRGNERTFEFTHKSFGEYLTACRIVRGMERIQKQLDRRQEDMEDGWDKRDALKYWAEVCGPTRMDTYLLGFLRDEVACKPVERVRQWQQTFAGLIGFMLRQGMPMERVEPPLLKFHQANQWAINAEEALIAALNSCATVTKEISDIDWPSTEAFGAWIKRLQGQRVSPKNVVALESLSYLNLEQATLDIQDLYAANLEGANLEEASLEEASLNAARLEEASLDGASLDGASLDGASLDGASLEGARLDEASLDGASLVGASLVGASLVETRLEGASLDGAILVEASLNAARLDGASLVEARLDEASLDGASLDGARLDEASLDGASLDGASLDGANLEWASLRSANLTAANLQGIRWDDQTNWDDAIGLEKAINVPEELKKQLGLA